MKKILPVILLLLVLCGCSKEKKQPTPTEATVPPVAADTYLADSDLEKSTGGAVRSYDITAQWLAPMSDGVVLAHTGDQTTLTVLAGDGGTVTATATIPGKITENCRMTSSGLWYYASESREVVLLSSTLTEIKRLAMPEDMTDGPVFSQDGKNIYFCAGQSVRALDAELEIIRPLRENTCQSQKLLGCWLSDDVLGCCMETESGVWETIYISGENGLLLKEDSTVENISFYEDRWLATRRDGILTQYIYPGADGLAQQLNLPEGGVFPVLKLDGALHTSVTEDKTSLNFYTLSTGQKTAAVQLPNKTVISSAVSDGGGLWLLTGEGKLLHWELSMSLVAEEALYNGPIYTPENPDTEGLAACKKRADDMGKQYGVTIRIGERALMSNDDYDLEVEFQPEAINKALDDLEATLKKYPDKFLYRSVNRSIRVCIVRSVGGAFSSAYHWFDADPFIILSVGTDIESAFLDGLSYIVDIHILGNTSLVDAWAEMNPEGFTYGAEAVNTGLLEGPGRAFADADSMKSMADDRASIFYYAMLSGNEEMFQAEIMQDKLLLLCQAIRHAWRLEKSKDVLPWEQYLHQSLAYTGK